MSKRQKAAGLYCVTLDTCLRNFIRRRETGAAPRLPNPASPLAKAAPYVMFCDLSGSSLRFRTLACERERVSVPSLTALRLSHNIQLGVGGGCREGVRGSCGGGLAGSSVLHFDSARARRPPGEKGSYALLAQFSVFWAPDTAAEFNLTAGELA